MRCPEVARRVDGTTDADVVYQLGELVNEYVNLRRIYANGRSHIPKTSDMACLARQEQAVVTCYNIMALYDETYRAYRSEAARMSREPRLKRHFPEE